MGSANAILYARWTTATTYTVNYLGNGATSGSAPIDSVNYLAGQPVTAFGKASLALPYSSTAVWNTQANGGGTSYAPGTVFAMGSANLTLYAQWRANDWKALGSGLSISGVYSCYHYVDALAYDPLGNVYVAGGFNTAGGSSAKFVAKWNGSSWSALGSGRDNEIFALACDGSGNLFTGGDPSKIAKWDGSAWSILYDPGATGAYMNTRTFARDSAGNLYACGHYFNPATPNVPTRYIMKLAGGSWSYVGAISDVYDVNVLACDGSLNLYAGGSFTDLSRVPANSIAKWNGNAWSALGSGTNGEVDAIAFDVAGNLYVGGSFTSAGGVAVNNIAKWNGTSWTALNLGVNDRVLALAFDALGNLYAGGYFTTADGISAAYLAKWNGTVWSAVRDGVNGYVTSLIRDPSGNMFAGGDFTMAGGLVANSIAELVK